MANVMKKHHGVAMLVAVLVTLIIFSILIIFVIALTWRNIRVQAWDAQRRNLQMLSISTAVSVLEGISNDANSIRTSKLQTAAARSALRGNGISASFDAGDNTVVNIKITGSDVNNPQVTCNAQYKDNSSAKGEVTGILSGDSTTGRFISWR
jgi:hypothetical protein